MPKDKQTEKQAADSKANRQTDTPMDKQEDRLAVSHSDRLASGHIHKRRQKEEGRVHENVG